MSVCLSMSVLRECVIVRERVCFCLSVYVCECVLCASVCA